MTAAEIDGAHASNVIGKLTRDVLDEPDGTRIAGLAEGVNVKNVDLIPRHRRKRVARRAEARVGCARIVKRAPERRVRVARIDADAGLQPGMFPDDGKVLRQLLG